ncbi:ankyrin repeat protein [Ancylostoma ceylanicum]|uniref:Ankyrin repeat protein n=1 Tax=Ancylostoma ceylanicum TaxID=53326 RepID=A0A0D6LC65_9BILA|nr:ankyrin repeat protein [Ancylostoma ceylanicum]
MKACRLKENGIETIRILHKYGGDVNAQADFRQDMRTPMHYALLSGSAELVKFLIGLGAKVNMPKGYDKPSIIDIAVLKDDPELLKIIIDAGAEVNAVHTYIGSALHLAACSILEHQYEILRLLLEAGADPNIQHQFPDGSQLKSPFVEYFRSRDVVDSRVVHLLLAYGGKVVMRSPINDTRGQLRNVLRLAATRDQPQVLNSMLELGEEFDVGAIDRLPLPVALKGDILERAKNPASLQQICRLNLRSRIAPFRPDVVSGLPIPAHMKDYVLGRSH